MSLQYTIHSQPRISSLSLTITDLDPCLLALFQQICVESTPEEEGGLAIVLSHNDPYSTAPTVRIPISVHGGGGGGAGRLVPQQQQRRQTIALHPAKDSYECRIPCFPPLAGANHNNEERLGNTLDILVPPLSAEVLNKAHVSAARCKACGEVVLCAAAGVTTSIHNKTTTTSLPLLSDDCTAPPGKRQRRTSTSCPIPPPLRPPPTYTFRALPSAHWHESSEAWLCHPSGAFTAKIQAQMERGWWPCDGVGLVAERWVNLSVREESVGLEMDCEQVEPSLTTWTPLHCKCGASLGTRNVRWLGDFPLDSEEMTGIQLDSGAAGKREVAVSYRLEKYAVEFLGGEDDGADTSSQRPALSCTVDECLAIEMLEHAQSLGIRKFVVFNEQAEEERLFLWLFNPDTDIAWGNIHLDMQTGLATCDSKSGKFVTVLWRETTTDHPIPVSERHETVDYPAAAITQIRAVLEGRDEGVPRDGKVVGEWRVGYLRRG